MASRWISWVLFALFCASVLFLAAGLVWTLVRRARQHQARAQARALEPPVEKTLQRAPSGAAVCSAIGDRDTQQDAAAVDEALPYHARMAIVCDGMGGMENGGEASRLCVAAFARECRQGVEDPPAFLRAQAHQLNQMVCELRDENGRPIDSGTTLVALVLQDGCAWWLHVGDSRIYLWRGGRLYHMTRDHNYALQLQEEVTRGRMSSWQAAAQGQQEALVSYIGAEQLERIDVGGGFPLYPGDIFLLCSDGLTKALQDDQLQWFFEQKAGADADLLARELVALALQNKRPRQDNTTAAVVVC